MKKLGRPALPKKQVRKVFPIRLSDHERAAIEKAAKRDKQKLSLWVRNALLKAAS
jgi:predicted HicB family RNase H-like nuclease